MYHRNIGLLFVLSCLVLSLHSSSGYAESKPLPPACITRCTVPFGKVLGVGTGNVLAYSNCNSRCINPAPVKWHGVYTGIKWQCVEYARRWLLVNRGEVYGDVKIAADIWALPYVTRVKDKKKFRMVNYVNGSRTKPVAGDLLIYAKAYLNTGHVAVIAAVKTRSKTIDILEENYRNMKWPGHYARRIHYILRKGHYWILDPYILGWKHITRQPYTITKK